MLSVFPVDSCKRERPSKSVTGTRAARNSCKPVWWIRCAGCAWSATPLCGRCHAAGPLRWRSLHGKLVPASGREWTTSSRRPRRGPRCRV